MSDRPKNRPYRNKREQKVLYDKIANLYYEKKMSSNEISKIVNITPSSILKILKRHFQGSRSRKEASKLVGEKLRGRKFEKDKVENMRKGWIRTRNRPEYKELISKQFRGENAAHSKLKENQVIEIRNRYENMLKIGQGKYETEKYLAEQYNVGRGTIADIIHKRTWKHI